MLIRPWEPRDTSDVIDLSIRAWTPVFRSLEAEMDPAVFTEFYPEGWRSSQRAAVEAVLSGEAHRVWIAESGSAPIGFVAVELRLEEGLGEIHMIAVDPDQQARGVGTALTRHALGVIEEAGLGLAMVETGGDPGHRAARRLYEKAGFSALTIVRYFKKV